MEFFLSHEEINCLMYIFNPFAYSEVEWDAVNLLFLVKKGLIKVDTVGCRSEIYVLTPLGESIARMFLQLAQEAFK